MTMLSAKPRAMSGVHWTMVSTIERRRGLALRRGDRGDEEEDRGEQDAVTRGEAGEGRHLAETQIRTRT